jgi:NADH-quinone oxidoreductase subunit J
LLIYAGIVLGAIGVFVALPRRKPGPRGFGALIAAGGAGIVLVTLTVTLLQTDATLNLFFHLFGFLALASALRVITHRRPVYSALWFIFTILSTSGLFILLSAEFLTFALIIIYAGAILITYLFVIMLASQAPSEEEAASISGYDAQSREPLVAVLAGFVLLAVLTSMMNVGIPQMRIPTETNGQIAIADLQGKLTGALEDAGFPEGSEVVNAFSHPQVPWIAMLAVPEANIDPYREAVENAEEDSALAAFDLTVMGAPNRDGTWSIGVGNLPESVRVQNLERVGHALVAEHPMALELAGIILLLAMVGAVVLSRKQIELNEEEKLAALRSLQEAA